MIGDVIGNFRLLSILGRGGMGEVYLGEHVGIQNKVAVKLLHAEISSDTDHVQRFFNEQKIVGKIKHAGIVKIFDSGFHKGHAYLTMELLEGESLAKRLQRVSRLPCLQIADIGKQIASILEATHRHGIIHRDLKPDNIYLVVDDERPTGERVKILDFGIAKLSGTMAGGSPKTMGTMGTPAYMAPEQWGDSAAVDWRADAYSLGCVAYEIACGRPPFIANNIAQAYAQHLNEAPPPPRTFAPELPEGFDAIVYRLLAKHPDQRPTSMAEIGNMFGMLGQQSPGGGYLAIPAASYSHGLAMGSIGGNLAETVDKINPTPVRITGVPTGGARPTTDGVAATTPRTTLGQSMGQVTGLPTQAPKKHSVVVFAALGTLIVGGVIIAIVAANGGTTPSNNPTTPVAQPTPTPLPVAPPAAKPDTPVTVQQPTPTPPAGSGTGSAVATAPTPTPTPTPTPAPTPSPTPHPGFHPGKLTPAVQHISKPPPVDSDGDGVPDSDDWCRMQPGPASNHGCPIAAPKPQPAPQQQQPPPPPKDNALDGRT